MNRRIEKDWPILVVGFITIVLQSLYVSPNSYGAGLEWLSWAAVIGWTLMCLLWLLLASMTLIRWGLVRKLAIRRKK